MLWFFQKLFCKFIHRVVHEKDLCYLSSQFWYKWDISKFLPPNCSLRMAILFLWVLRKLETFIEIKFQQLIMFSNYASRCWITLAIMSAGIFLTHLCIFESLKEDILGIEIWRVGWPRKLSLFWDDSVS